MAEVGTLEVSASGDVASTECFSGTHEEEEREGDEGNWGKCLQGRSGSHGG
jgi:hypothetical protein